MEREILFFLLQFFFEKDGISTKEKKDCNVQPDCLFGREKIVLLQKNP